MFSHFQQPFLFLDRLCYLNTPHRLYHSTFLCLFIPESLSACHHFYNSTHCLQPYLQSIKHRFRTDWWWLIDFFFSSKWSNLPIPSGGFFTDSFSRLHRYVSRWQVGVFMSDSLNHSFNWFNQTFVVESETIVYYHFHSFNPIMHSRSKFINLFSFIHSMNYAM